jgi:hypothetical protein
MRVDEQQSIIDPIKINILTQTTTGILIAKFNGSNDKQFSADMALPVE